MATQAPAFTFDPVTHIYTVGGITYPSITQVIEAAGLADYSQIPESDLDFYKARGTALHQACWFDDEGDLNESTVDDQVLTRLHAWRKFRRDFPFTILVSERRMFDRLYQFAGTPDRLVQFPDGHKGVIELKSGPLQPAVAVQLAAQAHLFEPQGGRLRRLAVHLKADGAFAAREFPLATMRQDLSVYLSALTVFSWRKKNA